MKRRIISLILTLCLIAAVMPVYASAETVIASGKHDLGPLTWEITSDGTLTILGNRSMQEKAEYAWDSYADTVTRIVVGDGITTIAKNAFIALKNTKSVYIGNAVEVIDEAAFGGLTQLEHVVFPESLQEIKRYAFHGCSGLKTVEFAPNGVLEIIGQYAFANSGVQALTIPSSVKTIDAYAFRDCTNLSELNLTDGLETIGVEAFADCPNLTGLLYLSETIQMISPRAFENTTSWTSLENNTSDLWDSSNYPLLRTLSVGGSRKSSGVYENCTSLTDVTFSASITEIDAYAFCGCTSLKSITIPDTVTLVEIGAFRESGLTEIYFRGDAPEFEQCFTNITATVYYPAGNETWIEEVRQGYGGTITWVAQEHEYAATETVEPTCTEQGYTVYTCSDCGHNTKGDFVDAPGHSWDDENAIIKTCTVCGVSEGGYRITIQGWEIHDPTLWVDGKEYPLKKTEQGYAVDVEHANAKTLVRYAYNDPDARDLHTQYPTGMKIWILEFKDGEYTAIDMPQLGNLLQYSGSSIRIAGKKGIRMITSINKETKAALTGKGIDGYTLVEYGTLLGWASELDEENPLVLGKPYAKSNYAYKKGVADPVFKDTGKLVQYTNVLVGFTNDQCKDDIAMRPYIILQNSKGEQITVYGGMIYRSIGYIAYQNRVAFRPGTNAYNFVWEIIHHVYGNKYDADYKG